MYIDLLDSAKSGHPIDTNTQDEWWRANDKEMQLQAISIAQAAVMLRLLFGDTIVLSHNQIFDSYAWMSSCDSLFNVTPSMPFLPITWAAYKETNPTPESFIKKAINIFRPAGESKFKLSAWPGLDDKKREIIAKNIESSGSFENMFNGFVVDNEFRSIYEEQQFAISNFYDYLVSHYDGNINWTVENPTVIKTCDDASTSIWQGLLSKKNEHLGMPEEIIDQIEEKIGTSKLEYRSDLYSAISDVDEDLRLQIRKIIDYYYNKKTGESTTGGTGLFSILDQDLDTPIFQDETFIESIDQENLEEDFRKEAFQFLPGEFQELSTLRFSDFEKIFIEPKIKSSFLSLHNLLKDYQLLVDQNASVYQFFDLEKRFDEWVNNHQLILTKELEGKVSLKNDTLIALIPKAVFAGGIAMAIKGLISCFGGNVATGIILTGIGSITGLAGKELLEKVKSIPTSAAARIKRRLQKSIKKNY